MKILTSSSLSAFRDCPRKYQFSYELNKAPVSDAPALSFGSLMHGALEAYWKGGLRSLEATRIWLTSKAKEIDEQTAARAIAMLRHYEPKVPATMEVVDVEHPFETRIENPDGGRAFYGYRLSGKIDLLLRDTVTGSKWILDHKTTTQEIIGFGRYWQALQIDAQMGNYCLAVGADGFFYDVLRVPSIKLCAKDETEAKKQGITAAEAYQKRCEEAIVASPEEWCQCRCFQKDDTGMKEAARDLWQQAEMFRACENDSRFPRNSNSCVGRYGNCPFIEVCCGRADINDPAAFRDKVAVHEELE